MSELRGSVTRDGAATARDRMTRLTGLIGRKVNELESTLALNEKSGREAAFQLIDTGIGKRTMDEHAQRSGSDGDRAAGITDASTARWNQDIEFARIGMLTMTAFTVALLLVVWALARRELALREDQQRRSAQEQARLESVVSERTAELSELSNYLQSVREEEKSHLARDIHDELGGILVGAKMDVAWAIERHEKERLGRRRPSWSGRSRCSTKASRSSAASSRNCGPTLLDNLGLAAALDWQVRQTCDRAGLECELESRRRRRRICLRTCRSRSIGSCRKRLTNIVKYAKAQERRASTCCAPMRESRWSSTTTASGLPAGAETNALSHGISGMRQRVRALQRRLQDPRAARQGYDDRSAHPAYERAQRRADKTRPGQRAPRPDRHARINRASVVRSTASYVLP